MGDDICAYARQWHRVRIAIYVIRDSEFTDPRDAARESKGIGKYQEEVEKRERERDDELGRSNGYCFRPLPVEPFTTPSPARDNPFSGGGGAATMPQFRNEKA